MHTGKHTPGIFSDQKNTKVKQQPNYDYGSHAKSQTRALSPNSGPETGIVPLKKFKSEFNQQIGSSQSQQRRVSDSHQSNITNKKLFTAGNQQDNTTSPPTFMKGLGSQFNFRETKYSNNNNFISENTYYELQEVQEKTIYEEENEHAFSAAEQHRSKKKGSDANGPSSHKSKNLARKQQTLVK